MNQNKVAWRYTDDVGVHWVRFATKAIVDQLNGGLPSVGGQAADGTETPMPRSFKPRRALVKSAAGVLRQVVCYDTTAHLFATPGATINLETGGADVAFTQYGHRGEVPTKGRASAS